MGSGIKNYVKTRIWDYLLCTMAGLGLTVNIFASFVMEDNFSSNMGFTLMVSAVMTFLLFAAAFNKKTLLVFIFCFIIAVILGVIYIQADKSLLQEGYGQSVIFFWIITVVTALVIFLLTRSRAGILVLWVIGLMIMAVYAFLQYPVVTWGYLLFVFGTAVSYFYRDYFISVLKSKHGKTNFKIYFLQTLLIVTITLGLSGGIFKLVIEPLNPPTYEAKLITKLMSFKILEKIGISSKLSQTDYEKLAKQLSEDVKYSSNKNGNKDDVPQEETQKNKEEEQKEEGVDENNTDINGNIVQDALGVSYEHKDYTIVFIIIGVMIVLALPFVLKRILHKSWISQVLLMDKETGAVYIYCRIMDKLRIAGFKKPVNITLSEYVINAGKTLDKFTVEDISLKKLTGLYTGILYGKKKIDEKEYKEFWAFYKQLRKNIRKEIGVFKFTLKYFAL